MQFCLVCFSALQHHIQYSTVMLHLENLVPLLSFVLIRQFVECLSTGNSLDIVLDIELEFRFEGKTPPQHKMLFFPHCVYIPPSIQLTIPVIQVARFSTATFLWKEDSCPKHTYIWRSFTRKRCLFPVLMYSLIHVIICRCLCFGFYFCCSVAPIWTIDSSLLCLFVLLTNFMSVT